MRHILTSFAFLMILLCHSSAEAQQPFDERTLPRAPIQDAIGLGTRAGFFTGDVTNTEGWFTGLHGRFRFGPVIGLETAVDYQWFHQYQIDDEDFVGEADVRSIPITASALVHVPFSQYIVPYAIAGAGAYITFEEFDDVLEIEDETSSHFGFHLGTGLEFPVSRTLAFHGDWRYLFLDDTLEFNEQMFSGSTFTFGLTYYFR